MAYSKLGIINLALGKLGNSKIVASLSEDTAERIAATTVWEYIVDEVNEAKDWRFAKTRVFLGGGTPVDTETYLGWDYAYQLPTDFLRLPKPTKSSLKSDPAIYPLGLEYKIEVVTGSPDDYFVLLSDYDNANEDMYCVYIKRQSDLTLWSPTAISALAFRLAAEMVFKLTEGLDKYSTMMTLYNRELARAESITQSYDSLENEIGNDTWETAGR